MLGYGADGQLRPLRTGAGSMICLAPNPAQKEFHVACYHRSLEPFMARGRALRAGGLDGRAGGQRPVRRGPRRHAAACRPQPAALYSLSGR